MVFRGAPNLNKSVIVWIFISSVYFFIPVKVISISSNYTLSDMQNTQWKKEPKPKTFCKCGLAQHNTRESVLEKANPEPTSSSSVLGLQNYIHVIAPRI